VYENVPALDLRSLYSRAAVLVIPLVDTSHGSGHTVLLEGMALGKLIIVSATRSMVGYVQDRRNALLVFPGDVKALRETLVGVLERPEEYAFLRKGAVVDARNRFDSAEFARSLQKVVRGLRASKGSLTVGGQSGTGNQKEEGMKNASLS
jgi:glycosyltransferase involved in cell wall biosynthesis